MAILDSSAVAAVLKTQYNQKKVYNLVYKLSPLMAKIQKRKTFYGDNEVVAIQIGNPQAFGHSFAVAQGNLTPTIYRKFIVPRVKDYGFANVGGEAVDAASNDQGSLLVVLKREFDNAFYTAARRMNRDLFQKGGGAMAQIGTSTTIASNVIQLSDPNQVTNFEVNQVLNLAATDGTSGAKRAGTLTVTAVNRDIGAITVSGLINTVTGAAVGDYIFQNGDIEAVNTGMLGIPAWIPKVAPTTGDSFCGIDRSIDTRLSGVRYTASSGGPIEETLIQAAARLVREGGSPDVAVLNPLDYANLVTALGSKVIYDRSSAVDDPEFGFKTLRLMGPTGEIEVFGDLNVPTGDCWMLQTDTWHFDTLKDAPRILDLDNLQMLRSPNSDDYQFRVGWYGNLICEAPGFNAYVKI